MMGIRMPETCWAVSKRQAINLLLIAASSWLSHLNVWRCTDLQTLKLVSGLVMVNNKQTEAPNRGTSVRWVATVWITARVKYLFLLCDVRTGTRVHPASCPTVPRAVLLDISGQIVRSTFVWYWGVKLRGAYFHVLYTLTRCSKPMLIKKTMNF